MIESILTSVKKLLGIDESYEHFDTDIIIAGHIAPYLQEHYDELREEVSRFPAFRDEQVNLIIDTTSSSPMAEGAAMLLIADYVDNYIENVYE